MTPEDQNLVDAFIAKHGVTKVPAGESGEPGFVWDGHRLVTDLTPQWAKKHKAAARARKIKLSNIEKIKAAYSPHKTAKEISAQTGISPGTVCHRLRGMGLQAKGQIKRSK